MNKYITLEKAFLKRILPIFIISTFLSIFLSQYRQMTSQYASLDHAMDVELKRLVFEVTTPLWNLNYEQLDDIAEIILMNRNAAGISILNEAGESIASSGYYREFSRAELEKLKSTGGNSHFQPHFFEAIMDFLFHSSKFERVLVKSSDVYFTMDNESVLIGNVYLIFSDQYITSGIRRDFFRFFLIGVALLLIFSSIIFITYHGIVTSPLRDLQQSIIDATGSSGSFQSPPVTTTNEIEHIRIVFKELWRNQSLIAGELEESKNFYHQLLESLPLGVVLTDNAGTILFHNEALAGIVGYSAEEIRTMTLWDLLPDRYHHIQQGIRSSREIPIPYTTQEQFLVDKDGRQIPVSVNRSIIQRNEEILYWSCVENITKRVESEREKKELQKQVSQRNKVEMLGQLAGGIAHDFNNLLTPIIGYVEIVLTSIEKDGKVYKYLESVLAASRRAGELVKQILAFSHNHELDLKPLDVNIIINDVLELFRASLPSSIDLIPDLSPDCGLIKANPTHIHQIVMNLCTNAYHALEGFQAGSITVSFKRAELYAGDLPAIAHSSGSFVCLSVQDTGRGMDKELLDRIFEPYFTTKEKKKGTGLGLAITDKIIKDYGGCIVVESEKGKGSLFRIYLPLVIEDPETGAEEVNLSPLSSGEEHILVIDDEAPVGEMTREILQFLGYKVTLKTESPAGLDYFEKNSHSIDLVITDMTMPDLTGDRLAGKMMEINDSVPIIIMTGFSENFTEKQAEKMGIKAYLSKPVSMKTLSEAVKRVLERKSVE